MKNQNLTNQTKKNITMINNIVSISKEIKVWSLAAMSLLMLQGANAQTATATATGTGTASNSTPIEITNKKPKLNRWAIGLRFNHLYDLRFTAYDQLGNGFAGEDLEGLKGSKTKFDFALGADLTYFFSPLVSMDLAYDFGNMTGANQIDYYESKVNFLNLGLNYDLKTSYGKSPYRWVPYLRGSIGRGSYDTERKFIEDDGTFSESNGTCFTTGMGAGLRYHINKNWHLNLQSEFYVVYSDNWDGYNYGSGKDHMMKTVLAVRYSFGKNEHQDRVLAWQGSAGGKDYDEVIKSLNDSLAAERAKFTQVNSDIQNLQTSLTKDSDGDGVPDIKDHCPTEAYKTKDGCPEQVLVQTPGSSSPTPSPAVKTIRQLLQLEMNQIYFGVNSSELNAESIDILNRASKTLKDNKDIKINILGSADNTGSDDWNMKLSELRANKVAEYLKQNGIESNRVIIKALGKRGSDKGSNQMNRKVQFIIE
jgi:outer membrane protein OmpA-like peptidoglycan-associated protein